MLINNYFITKTLFYLFKKTKLCNYFIIFSFCFTPWIALGENQNLQTFAYTLAKKGNDNVVLYKLDSRTWKSVGSTGRAHIKSLAADLKSGTLYAVDGGKLGKLDPNTGKFSLIGEIGGGYGELGYINIDNVYALAFDENRNILYGTNRMNGFDVLLQINPKTGKIISNSMINSRGQKAAYKMLVIKTFYFGNIYDSQKIVDIAYNSKEKKMYIVHNYFSTLNGVNGYINIDTKTPVENYKVNPVTKLAGIAFNDEGEFFGTFSDNQISTTGELFEGGGLYVETGPLKPIVSNLSSGTFFYGLDFSVDNRPSCSYNLTVNNLLINSTTQIATNSIQSSAKIYGNTVFIAGNNVSLNNNFEVRKTANFEITIDENVCR